MANPLRNYLLRAAAPRALLRVWDEKRRLDRLTSRAQRLAGGRGQVELYLAFDDPYAAVALEPLAEICGRHRCRLEIFALAHHGLAGDPDAELRRAYAITDASRLARRRGRALARREPINSQSTAFVAAWAEAARKEGKIEAFCQGALAALWFENPPAEPTPEALAPLYEAAVGGPPPVGLSPYERRVRENERRLRRRGHWESPAARVAGEWFFAHERLEQIEERLAELGW